MRENNLRQITKFKVRTHTPEHWMKLNKLVHRELYGKPLLKSCEGNTNMNRNLVMIKIFGIDENSLETKKFVQVHPQNMLNYEDHPVKQHIVNEHHYFIDENCVMNVEEARKADAEKAAAEEAVAAEKAAAEEAAAAEKATAEEGAAAKKVADVERAAERAAAVERAAEKAATVERAAEKAATTKKCVALKESEVGCAVCGTKKTVQWNDGKCLESLWLRYSVSCRYE
jgi:flagellar biosynthesis GTPase FlhF